MANSMLYRLIGGLITNHNENLAIWATFYISTIVTIMLGAFLSKKVDELKFIYAWIIVGAVASLLPAVFINANYSQVWSMSILLGASFGIGLPSCLAYFAEYTNIENRGRIGGISFLTANASTLFFVALTEMFDLATFSVFFAFLRGLGLIIFFQKTEKQPSSQIKRSNSFVSILHDRGFQLYFIAWSMFPIIDSIERVLVDNYLLEWNSDLLESMGIVEPLVLFLSIFFAGLLCDRIGRKKIVLSGFVALGVGYAIIGIIPDLVYSWYLYFIIDGIAWGIFFLIFVLTLWGDLAQSGRSEKYYALGSIPYFLSYIIPLLLPSSFVNKDVFVSAFSVASFFLFIAVIPLVFAPETLPEKKMELRRLRKFAEDAKKAKEKYERKREG